MTIEYAKELVLKSIQFRLDEEKEDCKKIGREYSKENIKYEIIRGLLFHDNYLDIASSMMMTETEKNNPVVGIREDIKGKYKQTILNELWEQVK